MRMIARIRRRSYCRIPTTSLAAIMALTSSGVNGTTSFGLMLRGILILRASFCFTQPRSTQNPKNTRRISSSLDAVICFSFRPALNASSFSVVKFSTRNNQTAIRCLHTFLCMQVMLDMLQCHALGLRVDQQHHKELKEHHHGENDERCGAGRCGHHWKNAGNQRVHEPMSGAAEALTFRADEIRKDFAQIHPNDGALRESERSNESYQQPHQQLRVATGRENRRDTGKADRGSDRSCEQQLFAAEPVDHAHGDDREHKIRE